MPTPDHYLDTCFLHNPRGRILSTREPFPARRHFFCIVRDPTHCAWSIHADLPDDLAHDIDQLARSEPPTDLHNQAPPLHADKYRNLLRAYLSARPATASNTQQAAATTNPTELLELTGPAMTFPDDLPDVPDVVFIHDERLLAIHFRGWITGEIARGRAPVLALIQDGHPVSLCFSARSSPAAAEAGVDTAPAYRGRGLAPRVTAAWAKTLRAQGRTPLYSTQWTNPASLAVARKLRLQTYATTWSLIEPS